MICSNCQHAELQYVDAQGNLLGEHPSPGVVSGGIGQYVRKCPHCGWVLTQRIHGENLRTPGDHRQAAYRGGRI